MKYLFLFYRLLITSDDLLCDFTCRLPRIGTASILPDVEVSAADFSASGKEIAQE
jgi:hypothetical protein